MTVDKVYICRCDKLKGLVHGKYNHLNQDKYES